MNLTVSLSISSIDDLSILRLFSVAVSLQNLVMDADYKIIKTKILHLGKAASPCSFSDLSLIESYIKLNLYIKSIEK